MIHDLAQAVFSALCHQQLDRAWTVGGTTLALCARCTGVYTGAAFGALALPLLRQRPSRALVALHLAAVLQMVVLGYHLWPPEQPAWLRTLSGQAFVMGAMFLLWMPVRGVWRARPVASQPRGASVAYAAAVTLALALPHILLHADTPWAAAALEAAALLGVASLGVVSGLALTHCGVCVNASPDTGHLSRSKPSR